MRLGCNSSPTGSSVACSKFAGGGHSKLMHNSSDAMLRITAGEIHSGNGRKKASFCLSPSGLHGVPIVPSFQIPSFLALQFTDQLTTCKTMVPKTRRELQCCSGVRSVSLQPKLRPNTRKVSSLTPTWQQQHSTTLHNSHLPVFSV